jgi:hypothetical protein
MTRALAPILAALALAAPASAGTLATPVFFARDGEYLICTVANTGTKAVKDVLVELVSFDNEPGSVVDTNGAPIELAPLSTASASFTPNGTGFDGYLCRFTFKGNTKTLRGGVVKADTGYNVLESAPAF